MRVAYFDCFAGASGDMILGALIDAGVSVDLLNTELSKLGVAGWSLAASQAMKRGLRATRALVEVDNSTRLEHRAAVERLIMDSALPEAVKTRSMRIFDRLFEAEARVHGSSPGEVHLHELGSVDTLVDVVGAVAGLDALGVEEVYVSSFPTGMGAIKTDHGIVPSPGPAVIELLKGAPLRHVDIDTELVTPTGAAILTTLTTGYDRYPAMALVGSGYGAGARDLPFANVLRMLVGETQVTQGAGGLNLEQVTLLETQIDDMPPEWYDHVMRLLLDNGALDVYLKPVQMKKNRPGTLLTVVCTPANGDSLAAIILTETTTLGVRRQDMQRLSLPREIRTVQTPYGPVDVKVAFLPGGKRRAAPEYEACRRIAEERGLPLWEIYRAAQAAATDGE